MLSQHDVISFVATALPERAKDFYERVLGFALVEDNPFAVVFDVGGGRMLRLQKLARHVPQAHTVLGWRVADIQHEMKGLAEKGVTFNVYPRMEQDDAGVWKAPDGHLVAWFSDPDGNNLSLTQFAS